MKQLYFTDHFNLLTHWHVNSSSVSHTLIQVQVKQPSSWTMSHNIYCSDITACMETSIKTVPVGQGLQIRENKKFVRWMINAWTHSCLARMIWQLSVERIFWALETLSDISEPVIATLETSDENRHITRAKYTIPTFVTWQARPWRQNVISTLCLQYLMIQKMI